MNRDKLAAGMGLLLIFSAGVASAESAEEVLEKVRQKYASINDAELKFSQDVTFQLSDISQHATGTLFLKKENKYRVELGDRTIVTDGTTVWSYSVPNNQVLIDDFKKNDRALSPEKLLTAPPSDEKALLVGKERVGKYETIVVKLVPSGDDSFVLWMKLWVDKDDWMIRKVQIADIHGKETTYVVIDAKINVGLQDSRFVYHIPQGAEVVDLR